MEHINDPNLNEIVLDPHVNQNSSRDQDSSAIQYPSYHFNFQIPDNPIPDNPKSFTKKMFELLSSSALGAGFGYLFGGFIKVLVDLAKIGINEMQKQSEKERIDKYIGINEYNLSGLSVGIVVGCITWLCVNEYARQTREREIEINAVQDIVDSDENNNFNGALNREVVSININDDRNLMISAEIILKGSALPDFGSQSGRSVMILGGGNLSDGGLDLNSNGGNVNLRENVNTTRSRGASLEPIAENEILDVSIHNEVALENPNQSIVNPNQQSLASPRGVIINIRNSQAVEEGGIAPLQRGFVLRVVRAIENIDISDGRSQ